MHGIMKNPNTENTAITIITLSVFMKKYIDPKLVKTGTKLNKKTFYKFSLYFLIIREYTIVLQNPQIIGALSN